MDILQAILKIYPDWKGTVWENDYNRIIPNELEARAIPTMAELETAWSDLQAILQRDKAIPAIQAILDAKANELGFDSIHTAAVWTISKNPARKARADALVAWGDAVWDFAEAEWEKQAEGKSTYTDIETFLADLPAFPGVIG
jgi:hypothetical protein